MPSANFRMIYLSYAKYDKKAFSLREKVSPQVTDEGRLNLPQDKYFTVIMQSIITMFHVEQYYECSEKRST